MNLRDLSPDEKDAMLMQMLAGQEGTAASPEVESEEEFLDPLINVIEILVQKVQELEEKHEMVERIVMDEIVGGVSQLYQKNCRMNRMDELKGKYSSKFDPYMDAYKTLNDGADDLWDRLYDHLDELKEAAGETGFNEDEAVDSIATQLRDKIEALKGTPGKAVIQSETIIEKKPEDELIDTIKRMKERK
jgi:hypothetical protein